MLEREMESEINYEGDINNSERASEYGRITYPGICVTQTGRVYVCNSAHTR
jgi:hypothetical protein